MTLATNQKIIKRFGRAQISRVRFNVTGRYLCASVENDLLISPTEGLGEAFYKGQGHTNVIKDFCWDGNNAYTCSDHDILLWDLRSASPYHRMRTTRTSACIDFIPEKGLLFTGDTAGYITSWDLRTLKMEKTSWFTTEHKDTSLGVSTIAVSPDRSWICIGSQGGEVHQYVYENQDFIIKYTTWSMEACAVAQCAFARQSSRSAVVAFADSLYDFNPVKEHVYWSQGEPLFVTKPDRFLCCTASTDGVIYAGTDCGHIVSYSVDSDYAKELPLDIGGEIVSLDVMV